MEDDNKSLSIKSYFRTKSFERKNDRVKTWVMYKDKNKGKIRYAISLYYVKLKKQQLSFRNI